MDSSLKETLWKQFGADIDKFVGYKTIDKMKLKQYHNNLSNWFRQNIFDLTNDVKDTDLWTKFDHINSPGWTLLHLIVECELALVKIKPEYEISVNNFNEFMYGSSGHAKSNISVPELLKKFNHVYLKLETEVSEQLDILNTTVIKDEDLKSVLKTELDFYIHILTTHIAMHCDALLKWRLNAGMKRPYE